MHKYSIINTYKEGGIIVDISNMAFNNIKRPKLSDQLFSELMELITKNKLKPGDAFPTETDSLKSSK